MGLERFLAIVPLKTPVASVVGDGSELGVALSGVQAAPGVTDDKLWVLKVIR